MAFSIFASFLAGTVAVLQSTINKDISARLSLQLSLLLNNCFVLALSILLFVALRFVPEADLPSVFRTKGSFADFQVRYLITGLCGFLMITLLPWAVERAGAARVFICVVVAQIAVSMIWDYFAESLSLTWNRVLGALLALAGAILAAS